jgi:RNA polymerase sigma-70 factor, ECF subfamily
MMGSDADAQDALQDALIAIARGIRRFDGRAAFTTWSYRVATNACLDELRRRGRRPVPGALAGPAAGFVGSSRSPGVVDGLDAVDALDSRIVGGSGGAGGAGGPGDPAAADGGIAAVADRLAIEDALAQLPPDFRAAVTLRDLCDLDYADIARVLDIPPGTVRSRIARGRALLAGMLGNPGPLPDRPTSSP